MRLFLLFCLVIGLNAHQDTVSSVDKDKYSLAKDRKYLIYDINRGEGFNLRRDVYMRVANTVRLLREEGENYILVLPPWGGLYHWQRQQILMPWKMFFNLKSLNQFVPVMEFQDFLDENPARKIDQVVYLQHYKEGWGQKYELKYDRRECMDGQKYYKKEEDGKWHAWFFGASDVKSEKFECVSIQGESQTLKTLIMEHYRDVRSVFIDRAETILHENYGEEFYWKARRSMRYAQHLVDEATNFRKKNLDSTDDKDQTHLPTDWQEERPGRQAKGGPYICAHWRRQDFLRAHSKHLPSIKGTANILNNLTNVDKVDKVYIATDADESDVKELDDLLEAKIFRFNDERRYSDGEIAIIDQIICSHARYFTGSHYSTFSFRIQEDREILGFKPETTFNRMCSDREVIEKDCEQPAKWTIKY